MSKKRFGLNQNIERGFSETVNLVENFKTTYDTKPLTLARITPDPTNPRHLKILPSEIDDIVSISNFSNLNEIAIAEKVTDKYIQQIPDDVNKKDKIHQIESIKELAIGISKNGLLHPIITYKESENYIVVAGERRLLAHLLLGRKYIESRIFTEKPSNLTKKVAQWIENVQREDLSTYARIENIIHISEAHQKETDSLLTPSILSELSGVSKASASYYLSVVNGPQDVLLAIKENKLQNIKKAALIANEKDEQKRAELLEAAIQGMTAEMLKSQQLNSKKVVRSSEAKRKGRAYTKVQFGFTKNMDVAKKLILAVIAHYKLNSLDKKANSIDWQSYEKVTEMFKEVMHVLGDKQ